MEQEIKELINKEGVELFYNRAFHVKSQFKVISGKLYLTPKRLVFVKNDDVLAGILLLLMFKQLRAKTLFNIELKTINEIRNEKRGLNKKIMHLDYNANQQVKFIVDDYQKWEDAINKHNPL
jgi:hypothetical protein